MDKSRLNNWRRWSQILAVGLLIVANFAPLPEVLRKILMLAALAGILSWLLTDSPEARKEAAVVAVVLVASLLLALLLSVNPQWMLYGAFGIYIGYSVWEVLRAEHAEYLEERERLR